MSKLTGQHLLQATLSSSLRARNSWEDVHLLRCVRMWKTIAAVHLLHGEDINFACPKRAIMVNASGSEDFPMDYARQQNVQDVSRVRASGEVRDELQSARPWSFNMHKVEIIIILFLV